MAYDKVVDSAELDDGLAAVADAIRDKTGETESLVFPDGFVTAIAGIATGAASNSAVNGEVHDITIDADLKGSSQIILLKNEFVASNYLKTGFMAFLFQSEPDTVTAKTFSLIHGNLNLAASGYEIYGYASTGSYYSVAGTAISKTIIDEMDSSTTRFFTDSVGSMGVYVQSGSVLSAGNYKLVLLCIDI